jgi:hypothetical protein
MEGGQHALPEAVWEALSTWGILLEQDALLPSVASLIAGRPIRGSWWGDPLARGTYEAVEALEDRQDVLNVKLVSGKVTFVLKRLWPKVLAIAQARETWQLDRLTDEAQSLLKLVDDAGSLRLDEVPGAGRGLREAARALEQRLLVRSGQMHTESGAHTKVLESWTAWAERMDCKGDNVTPGAAKETLEEIVRALNATYGANATLPWQSGKSAR